MAEAVCRTIHTDRAAMAGKYARAVRETEDVSIATEREKIKYKQSRSNNCGSVFCFRQ